MALIYILCAMETFYSLSQCAIASLIEGVIMDRRACTEKGGLYF